MLHDEWMRAFFLHVGNQMTSESNKLIGELANAIVFILSSRGKLREISGKMLGKDETSPYGDCTILTYNRHKNAWGKLSILSDEYAGKIEVSS